MWNRDDLIKPRTKTITVEGGEMVIRALRAEEALELREIDLKSKEIFVLVSRSVTEPELSVEDIGKLPTSLVTEIVTQIFIFNALGPKAIKDAQNELKKTQTEGETTN